jgi:4a-hydroxytetrahydrobiopterin dehydratase
MSLPMQSDLKQTDWSQQPRRVAFNAVQVVTAMAELPGWMLSGEGKELALSRTYRFADYLETLSFVQAVGFMAERQNHHPRLVVEWGRCTVQWNTHDAGGITATDMECARLIDALLSPSAKDTPAR